MAIGVPKTISGPAFLASSVADIYTPPASTMYLLIRHIHITNVTATAATYTLYKGATGGTAAGTELAKLVSVPPNSSVDIYFAGQGLKMLSTDFLSGLSGTASALTITVIGDQVVV